MKKLLKKFSGLIGALVLVMGFALSSQANVSLPTAFITGGLATDANGLSLVVNTYIPQVNYQDGTSAVLDNSTDKIIFGLVTITGATRATDPDPLDNRYPFNNAQLEIRAYEDNFLWISATLKNIEVVDYGDGRIGINRQMDATNPATLNLSFDTADNPNNGLFTDATHPSRFVDEWRAALGSVTTAGMTIVALKGGDPAGVSTSDIETGILDGSPEVVVPPVPGIGVRSMGYWKTHDEERTGYVAAAMAIDAGYRAIFAAPDPGLVAAVTKKGKKDMCEKARQQLAALLLNIAANDGLMDQALNTSQVVFVGPTLVTVGDALDDIEAVASDCSNTKDELERVKDLAESINTSE